MKHKLSQTEEKTKASTYFNLAQKYKEKYSKTHKKQNLLSSLTNLGFYYHCKAVMAHNLTQIEDKLKNYKLAAKTFKQISQFNKKNEYKAYTNEYQAYALVVTAGTSKDNQIKSKLYTKSSQYFTNAAKLFKSKKHKKDILLCKGWANLTKSCNWDAKAASEPNVKKRIQFCKKTTAASIDAYKKFSKLKISKLQKRAKSMEFSSKAWALLLQQKNAKTVASLFKKASNSIKPIQEWKNMSTFFIGLSHWITGSYSTDLKVSKQNLQIAITLFNKCGNKEFAYNSQNIIKNKLNLQDN